MGNEKTGGEDRGWKMENGKWFAGEELSRMKVKVSQQERAGMMMIVGNVMRRRWKRKRKRKKRKKKRKKRKRKRKKKEKNKNKNKMKKKKRKKKKTSH